MNAIAQTQQISLYDRNPMGVSSVMATEKSSKTSGLVTESVDLSALLHAVGKHKDREAFITLFNHFAPRVKSFLIKGGLAIETADEIAQETMLTVWNKADSFDPGKAKASTWIFTIARNKRIDFFRKTSRENIVDLELNLIQDNSDSPNTQTQHSQEKELIADAIESLPEEQAELIHKSFFEGKSHGEIAKETNIPLGTIKSRIRLALERLRGEKNVKDLK